MCPPPYNIDTCIGLCGMGRLCTNLGVVSVSMTDSPPGRRTSGCFTNSDGPSHRATTKNMGRWSVTWSDSPSLLVKQPPESHARIVHGRIVRRNRNSIVPDLADLSRNIPYSFKQICYHFRLSCVNNCTTAVLSFYLLYIFLLQTVIDCLLYLMVA